MEPIQPKKPRGKLGHLMKVKSAQAAERREEAWKLLVLGHDQYAIAKRLGVSQPVVCGYINDTLAMLKSATLDMAEDWRKLQCQRFDQILTKFVPMAMTGDHRAAIVVLQYEKRRAELLGLDAPVKHEVSGDLNFKELVMLGLKDGDDGEIIDVEAIKAKPKALPNGGGKPRK